jgi:hypothetical protein
MMQLILVQRFWSIVHGCMWDPSAPKANTPCPFWPRTSRSAAVNDDGVGLDHQVVNCGAAIGVAAVAWWRCLGAW